MKSLDIQQQLLIILMEECAEVQQECSKLLRKNSLKDLNKLTDELGDLTAMISLLHEFDLISYSDLEKREEIKREKLTLWSDIFDGRTVNSRKGNKSSLLWDEEST